MEEKEKHVCVVTLQRLNPFNRDELIAIKQFAEQLGCERLKMMYVWPTNSAMKDDKVAHVSAPIEDWKI